MDNFPALRWRMASSRGERGPYKRNPLIISRIDGRTLPGSADKGAGGFARLQLLPIPFTILFFPVSAVTLLLEQRIVPELKVLFSREQIAARVAELGRQISKDFAGEPVVLVGVLKGAAIFLSDLARRIELDSTFDFIAVSTYGDQKQSSGEVKLLKDVDQSMEGKNVILVEDILDTGLTMCYLKKMILAHRPKAFRIAALLDKKCRRLQPIQADYTGFEIPDEFVVGYGMDYAERYRNLPDICVFRSGVALPWSYTSGAIISGRKGSRVLDVAHDQFEFLRRSHSQ